jgi:DNA-binding NarL/FixJ family response regulator
MSAHVNKQSFRVLVVDDHELFRIGLRQLLEAEGFDVAAATSAKAALRRLPSLAPHVVVMGVNPPAGSAVEDIRLVLEAAPGTAVLMLTIVADDQQVLRAIKAGAAGYLLKDAELAQIVAGIRAVAAGHPALSPHAARVLIDHVRHHAEPKPAASAAEPRDLSARELQVLSLLATGCDNSQIGETLYVSRSTVKKHVSRLLEKLEVDNRLQAATFAIRAGLVDRDPRLN